MGSLGASALAFLSPCFLDPGSQGYSPWAWQIHYRQRLNYK